MQNFNSSALDLDSPYVKSFSTENMLLKKLAEYGVNQCRHVVCRTPSGRWTAIVCGFQQNLLNTGFPMIG